MRFGRAVSKLRRLAEACEITKRMPLDEPFLREAYVFGSLLDGTDGFEALEVALVLTLTPEEVPWRTNPRGTEWLVHELRLDKNPIDYYWRSHLLPVWNHHIRGPVRFWSLDGPDEDALRALGERRLDKLPRVVADPAEERAQIDTELDLAVRHLRAVSEAYWTHAWRKEHRGYGRYPEHTLWDATAGYLDLLDARV